MRLSRGEAARVELGSSADARNVVQIKPAVTNGRIAKLP
jgi:hypothetical protein